MKKMNKKLFGIIYVACILLIWWVWSAITNKELFAPSPASTLNVFSTLLGNGTFFTHLGASFLRVTVGILIATVISIPIGMLMSWYEPVGKLLHPIVDSFKFAPATVFQSLIVLYCGIGEEMKITLITVASILSFLPTVVQICSDNTDEIKKLRETAFTMGYSYSRMLIHCLIPYITPSLVESFINLYGVGWTYVVLAEANNTQFGLGHLMYIGRARGNTPMVFVAIITVFVFSRLFNKVATIITNKIFKWRAEDEQKSAKA